MFLPAHYLKQFHANYAEKADLDKLVAEAGVKTWGEMFYLKQDQYDNPDRPVLSAWKAKNRWGLPDEILVGKDKSWAAFHDQLEAATGGKYTNPIIKGEK